MTVKYPIWINKIEGAAQTPEEMNGIVEVLQNHAENLSLHDVRILAAASGIYTAALTPTSEVPAEVGDKVFLVTIPGTYTNFGNVVLPENNFGFIFKNGNNFSIQSVEMPMQDLTPIESKIYDLESLTKEINDITNEKTLTFILQAKSVQINGSFNVSENWIGAEIMDFKGSNFLDLSGFAMIGSGDPRVVFYTSTSQSQATKLSHVNHNVAGNISVDIPLGAVSAYVTLASGAGIGSDLPNSIYNSLFKAKGFTKILGKTLDLSKVAPTERLETEQIKELATNKFYDGNSYPDSNLGTVGDKYFNSFNLRIYIKDENGWGEGYFLGGENSFEYPSEFTFQPYQIMQQNNGYYYFKGFSNLRNEFAQHYIDTLTNYYVDSVNGNNSNNGLTSATALKTIQYAVMTKGARVLRLLRGNQFYGRSNTFDITTDIATNEPLIMIGEEDGVFLAQSDKGNAYTWTSVDNVWSAPRSSVINVFDFNQVTHEGNPKHLIRCGSLAECKSTVNSFFADASLVYINTLDGNAPTSKFELVLNMLQQYVPSENVPFVYFENITFANSAGGNVLIKNNATTQFNTKVYLYKCKGLGNHSTNNFTINNIKECWLQDCEAYDAKNDGFNYHTSNLSNGYTPMNVVEINCKGSRFGQNYPNETSSNASTVHEGISIIRMNCNYSFGRGGVVADVNGAKSLNLNVDVRYNYATSGNSASFIIQGTLGMMWLYDCYSKNIYNYSVIANMGAQCKYKDFIHDMPFSGDVIE
ncbi:hypothetical protein [Empedobacter falsenii]|uniref:Uncharacterized protein n=1 Tax=Empedobacter falsenii TaxID=343874 RepID=A0A3R8TYQ3_9FLAO|nr:hypothetical protein [Empedobacter falsenii]RRT94185.1 hypothetical protein EGI89_02120 [Empedobacter falsenii]RRT94379.1 hypothetical protein EGI88_02125 [Empedobacter falsenii]